MSKLDEDDKSVEVKAEAQPLRLGVGGVVPRESTVVRSNDPVKRRLRAKLEIDNRKVVKNAEEFTGPALDGSSHEDSDDEALESKTEAFAKKEACQFGLNFATSKEETEVTSDPAKSGSYRSV